VALIAAALASATPVLVDGQASFSSRVEAVRVDVLVSENGRPVEGLKPSDFEVRDNGVPQKVDLASFEEIPLNIVLVLDVSASLQGLRLGHLQTASRTLLDRLKADDRAALVTFTHMVVQGSELTGDLAKVRAAIDAVQGAGRTSLVDAAHAGLIVGESDVGRSLLLVFSDGVDTSSWLAADAVLDVARRSDVVAYGVAVGGGRAGFSRELSAATGGRLIEIESTQNLDSSFNTILDEFRMRYLISYSPQGVETGGWHRLDVRVKNRGLAVKARPGYLSGP
jgi:VWFA-related protein